MPTAASERTAATTETIRVPFVTLDREHAEIGSELDEAFARVVRASAFVLGEEVESFEAEWAATCGTAHCVGVASGTSALSLLLAALGVGRGDEVIVPAHTFVATAFAVLHVGAVPVLCDVDEATGLLDLEHAEALVSPRTAAVLPVHLYGQLADMEPLARFAGRHGIALVEDAAHAHGAVCADAGSRGSSAGAAFSFYPSKNLGALGDGGAVCTNDGELALRLRRLRNLGQRRKGEHVEVGFNARLDGLQAALLRVKLRHLAHANGARIEHAARYHRRLTGHVRLLGRRPGGRCVYHVFPVRVPERDAVARRLAAVGVQTGCHYSPALHHQPALGRHVAVPEPVPRAEAWAAEELSLPMSPGLTPAEVEYAAGACLRALQGPGADTPFTRARRRSHG